MHIHAKPKVAVVLSGGGAKGFAHVGVLKVLEEQGVPIDIIVGNSIGGVVGGLYSIGYKSSEIEQIIRSADWNYLLTDKIPRKYLSANDKLEEQRYNLTLPFGVDNKPKLPQAFVNGQNMINLFCGLTGNVPPDADFSEFPISFACIGADLETGKEVVIDSGFLASAMFSTMTIPGAFVPIEHNGKVMLDGGIVNNFPTDVARKMGADIIIGVDIRNDLSTRGEVNTIGGVINQLISFYSLGKDSLNKSLCDIRIRPDITGYGASSFTDEAADSLIVRGENAARKALSQIKKLKEDNHWNNVINNKVTANPQMWMIKDLSLSGHFYLSEDLIESNFGLDFPGVYTYSEIKNAVDKLYGYGSFNKLYFQLIPDEEAYVLNLVLDEKHTKELKFGMRLNTVDAMAVRLNFTQKDYGKQLGLVSLGLDISPNPGFNVLTEIKKRKYPTIGFELNGKYRKYDVYLNGEKQYSADLYFGSGAVFLYKTIKDYAKVGFGLKQEYFNGRIYAASIDTSGVSGVETHSLTNLYGYLSVDNLDDYYFPTKGIDLYTEFSLFDEYNYQNISPALLIKMRSTFPLDENFSFLFNVYGRAIFKEDPPVFKSTFVGGELYASYFKYHLPFLGQPAVMQVENYSSIVQAGLQLKIGKIHHISFLGNVLAHNADIEVFGKYSFVWGGGIRYAIKSGVGPLEMTVGLSDMNNSPTFSANLGFWF